MGKWKGFLTVFFFAEKQGDTFILTHLTVKETDVQYGGSNFQALKERQISDYLLIFSAKEEHNNWIPFLEAEPCIIAYSVEVKEVIYTCIF